MRCTWRPRSSRSLPQATMTPETTGGRQGFIHVYEMNGTAAEAS